MREGELGVTPDAVTLILESLDAVKSILAVLEATEAEPAGGDAALIERLDRLASGGHPGGEAQGSAPPARAAVDGDHTESKGSAVAAQSIRVDVDRLEDLMTLVSELVLTRNQLMQILRDQKDGVFGAPLQRLSHVTTELQEGVMKTRMQPIGNAWAKLPRIVRGLARELGKTIELRMRGAETELDRQLLEMIRDPLTHMVRNAADHGIEPPTERLAKGKPESGAITLDARHEGGHVVIEVGDDGRGLDIDEIKRKALSAGLATAAELAAMPEPQIQQFILKPGFSTARKVTSVSGRGVGMDVVRTNLEKIGGTLEMRSRSGKGSAFTLKIPLTLAIASALIVECAGERFAIPQLSVVELVRAAADAEHRIERINDTPVLRLRDRLLPLVCLQSLLALGKPEPEPERETTIVVTQVGAASFGVIVDRVFDTEEIVLKPVAPILLDIALFSGNTILGDGRVVMILDPAGVAAAAGGIGAGEQAPREEAPARADLPEDRSAFLLFRAGDAGQKAVPLALIARLEEIDAAAVERSNGKPVVQYRGKLMPLISVDPACGIRAQGRQPILVFADRDRHVGLVVDEIIDIVEEHLAMELRTERPGRIGSAIVAGKATEIIDAGFYLAEASRDGFRAGAGTEHGTRKSKRVLLVDDSPFSRNLLTPLLSIAGYEVTTVESGDRALGLCEAGEDFDVILSDIEMPGMDGFAFASAVRKAGRWRRTPLVALSAEASPDPDRGRAAGFSDCVAKFDREALLQSLSETLSRARGAA
jgi:two-component system chemotaxis sensor kinase CheA